MWQTSAKTQGCRWRKGVKRVRVLVTYARGFFKSATKVKISHGAPCGEWRSGELRAYFLACSKCKNTVVQSGAVAVCKRKYLLLEEDRKRLETSAKQNKPENPKNGKRADSYMCLKKYHRACFLFVCFFSVAVTMESIVMSGDSKTTLNHIIIINQCLTSRTFVSSYNQYVLFVGHF